MKTREEHLEWCKERAREYLEQHDIENAITSMLNDMLKHPETAGVARKLAMLGMHYIAKGDIRDAKHFVEGFR